MRRWGRRLTTCPHVHEFKKMKSLTLLTHGCPRTSLRDCSSLLVLHRQNSFTEISSMGSHVSGIVEDHLCNLLDVIQSGIRHWNWYKHYYLLICIYLQRISGEGGSAWLTPPLWGINSSLKEREIERERYLQRIVCPTTVARPVGENEDVHLL